MASTIPATSAESDRTRITERPDGFYWQSADGGREYGPFPGLREALEDMQYAGAELEAGEPLEEAEDEIGIAGWIDPDTGQPAEASIPHIEEH